MCGSTDRHVDLGDLVGLLDHDRPDHLVPLVAHLNRQRALVGFRQHLRDDAGVQTPKPTIFMHDAHHWCFRTPCRRNIKLRRLRHGFGARDTQPLDWRYFVVVDSETQRENLDDRAHVHAWIDFDVCLDGLRVQEARDDQSPDGAGITELPPEVSADARLLGEAKRSTKHHDNDIAQENIAA